MKNFQGLLKRVATPICQQHGFIKASLLLEWDMIVGEKFAKICQPEKVVFPNQKRNNGLLYVGTSSAFAPELSYLEPMIIDIVNKYYGYNAVSRLVIRHKKITLPSSTAIRKKQIKESDTVFIEQQIQSVEDPVLRAALRNLGQGIFQK